MIEISQELIERARAKCEELMPRFGSGGPLPFVQFDPANAEIVSSWEVADTGDEFHDLSRGVLFADMLVQRAKSCRAIPGFDPFVVIHDVLLAVVRKGHPGAVERGFLGRIAILALAAAAN